jgi:hypothetical protein
MQLDPMVSLAHALHSRPGKYALLLGSGVSRAAEIPTGWEIQGELLRKVRQLSGDTGTDDPMEWYRNTFGEVPNYSAIVRKLAPTSAERQALLEPFIRPSSGDGSGAKSPTNAHRAIAQLMKRDVIRVVITTNFDRLMENAATEVGLEPTIIASEEQAAGMQPLIHQPLLVFKVHGDYRDPAFLNTEDELRKYGPHTERLLREIFDSFGLIVCGWSAEWDRAICEILESISTRRFTTFWTTRGSLQPHAQSLARTRDAEIVQIPDADTFFGSLAEKTLALDQDASVHPLTKKLAAAESRRLIRDEADVPHLDRFVQNATERARRELEAMVHESTGPSIRLLPADKWLLRSCDILGELQAITMPAARWARGRQVAVLGRIIERLYERLTPAQDRPLPDESTWALPSFVMLYTIGTSMAAGRNWHGLFELLLELRIKTRDGRGSYVVDGYWIGFQIAVQQAINNPENLSASTWLLEHWESVAGSEISSPQERVDAFDRFELAVAITYLALTQAANRPQKDGVLKPRADKDVWAPFGLFCWKCTFFGGGRAFADELTADAAFIEAFRAGCARLTPAVDADIVISDLRAFLGQRGR